MWNKAALLASETIMLPNKQVFLENLAEVPVQSEETAKRSSPNQTPTHTQKFHSGVFCEAVVLEELTWNEISQQYRPNHADEQNSLDKYAIYSH